MVAWKSIWDTRFTSDGIASDGWITMKGAHILLGDDGTVQAGAGGKFTGKKLSESLKYVWSKKGESEADFMARTDKMFAQSNTRPDYQATLAKIAANDKKAEEAINNFTKATNVDSELIKQGLQRGTRATPSESVNWEKQADALIKAGDTQMQEVFDATTNDVVGSLDDAGQILDFIKNGGDYLSQSKDNYIQRRAFTYMGLNNGRQDPKGAIDKLEAVTALGNSWRDKVNGALKEVEGPKMYARRGRDTNMTKQEKADLRAARVNNDWSIDPPASVDSWFLYENKGRDLSSEQVYTIGNADSATIEKESAKALQITFRNNGRGTTCKTWVPKTVVIRQSEEQGGAQ